MLLAFILDSRNSSVASPRPLRVALFGFYGVGNFGDDLMAWMIAKELQSRGHRVSIFSLGRDKRHSLLSLDFQQQGFTISTFIDQTLTSCDAVIYGGGGVLVAHSMDKLKKFRLYFEREQQFLNAVKCRRLPLMVMSVGGDGGMDPDQLDAFAKDLVKYASTVTVRNSSDVYLMRALGLDSLDAPDLVWAARQILSIQSRAHLGFTIGLDLYPAILKRRGGSYFIAFLQALILKHPTIEFVFLNSRHRTSGLDLELSQFLRGVNVNRYRFVDFQSDVSILGSLDLLISSRLHVLMIALSCGVPVISIFAEAKTQLVLEQTGLDSMSFTAERLTELKNLLWSRSALDGWIHQIKGCILPLTWSKSCGSYLHFKQLDCFLQDVILARM